MSKASDFIEQLAAQATNKVEVKRMSDMMVLTIPKRHVEAVLDALMWASDEARHSAEIGGQYPWSYKRYEMALDLLDAEVRAARREAR